MEVRIDKFVSGHYAYFVELPDRSIDRKVKELFNKSPAKYYAAKQADYKA
jgi:hypothetical protein